jgi:hypothetical protein
MNLTHYSIGGVLLNACRKHDHKVEKYRIFRRSLHVYDRLCQITFRPFSLKHSSFLERIVVSFNFILLPFKCWSLCKRKTNKINGMYTPTTTHFIQPQIHTCSYLETLLPTHLKHIGSGCKRFTKIQKVLRRNAYDLIYFIPFLKYKIYIFDRLWKVFGFVEDNNISTFLNVCQRQQNGFKYCLRSA